MNFTMLLHTRTHPQKNTQTQTGYNRVAEDISMMLGFKPNIVFKITWHTITPFTLFVCFSIHLFTQTLSHSLTHSITATHPPHHSYPPTTPQLPTHYTTATHPPHHSYPPPTLQLVIIFMVVQYTPKSTYTAEIIYWVTVFSVLMFIPLIAILHFCRHGGYEVGGVFSMFFRKNESLKPGLCTKEVVN